MDGPVDADERNSVLVIDLHIKPNKNFQPRGILSGGHQCGLTQFGK